MTEQEWFAGTDPTSMVLFLKDTSSHRKLRLFACACCYRVGRLFTGAHDRDALAAVECFADGPAGAGELSAVRGRTTNTAILAAAGDRATSAAASAAAACATLLGDASGMRDHPKGSGDCLAAEEGERRAQCRLLRDIFGDPFRPVGFSQDWRTDTAVAIARQMYDSRDFSAMPILADALQDAGCDSDVILNHCRGPGPHVRGCWVVDLVLGKE